MKNFLNKKVKTLVPLQFNNSKAQNEMYIGTVVYLGKNGEAIVRLLPQYIGWEPQYNEKTKYGLKERYTYWWVDNELIDIVRTTMFSTTE